MEKSSYYNLSLRFINQLEGFKTSFKNFHWSASTLTYHRIIDDALSALSEFQDVIAETSQGYMGIQYKVGDVAGTKVNATDPLQALLQLNQEVGLFHKSIKTDDELAGVVNAVNDFQQELLKLLYLYRLAQKDGEEMEGEEEETKSFPKPSGLINIVLD